MPDSLKEQLQESFSQSGQIPTGPSYAHPDQDEIIRDAVNTLGLIEEGRRLIPLIKERNLLIRVILGRIPNVTTPDGNTIILTMPKPYKAVDPDELACNLAIGIKEIEINAVNIQRLSHDPHLIAQKAVDIIIEMCRLVSEFHDVNKNVKLVALLEKLGHIEVYKLFRSKASYQEMADQAMKSVT